MEPVRRPVPLPLARGTRRQDDWSGRLRFAPGALWREVRAGDSVVLRHGPDAPVHVVEAGLFLLALSTDSGARCIAGILGPGDLLGAGCLAEDGDARTPSVRAEAVALRPSRTLTVPASELLRMARTDTSTAAEVVAALARRVADLEASLMRSRSLRLRERILSLLEGLAQRWGKASRDGRLIAFRLTQEDIADMVGATRESVNRALRDLGRVGALRRSGRSYVVPSDGPRGPG